MQRNRDFPTTPIPTSIPPITVSIPSPSHSLQLVGIYILAYNIPGDTDYAADATADSGILGFWAGTLIWMGISRLILTIPNARSIRIFVYRLIWTLFSMRKFGSGRFG